MAKRAGLAHIPGLLHQLPWIALFYFRLALLRCHRAVRRRIGTKSLETGTQNKFTILLSTRRYPMIFSLLVAICVIVLASSAAVWPKPQSIKCSGELTGVSGMKLQTALSPSSQDYQTLSARFSEYQVLLFGHGGGCTAQGGTCLNVKVDLAHSPAPLQFGTDESFELGVDADKVDVSITA